MNKYKLIKILSLATLAFSSSNALAEDTKIKIQEEISIEENSLKKTIEDKQLIENSKKENSLKQTIKEKQLVNNSKNFDSKEHAQQKFKESLDYLSKNPAELEKVLSVLIRNKDAERLAELLPIYEKYPKRDMSVIDWGNAIIAESNNDYGTAVNLYRKINSALPNVKTLRFHMANALFRDKQYEAAKSEFEKLRSEEQLADSDKEIINSYLEAISQNDQWNFDMGISYIRDPNVNNSPKKGTQVITDKGVFQSNADQVVAKGIAYNFSTSKQWALDDNKYISGYLSGNGSYYWNSHQNNDLTLEAGVGLGYADAKKSLEVTPFFQNNFYVDGSNDSSKLQQYYKKLGVRLDGTYWINENVKYSAGLTVARDKFINKYKHLSGNDFSLSNTLFYMPNQRNYFYGGLDASVKTGTRDTDDSYNRVGTRLGWGRAWNLGISTNMGIGFANKSFKGKDFLGIKRKDKEYNLNMSIWHRNVHILGITPRLTWNYRKIDGNHPLYNYDKSNISLGLSKTF